MRWAVQVGCVLSLDLPLASGSRPPGFNPLRRGWVYRPAPEAPLLRGMPTGPEAFLEMPGACGLRPCAWPHPKKGLVPYSSGWWDGEQITSPGHLALVNKWLDVASHGQKHECINLKISHYGTNYYCLHPPSFIRSWNDQPMIVKYFIHSPFFFWTLTLQNKYSFNW